MIRVTSPAGGMLKRIIDVTFSILGLLALTPLFVVVAFAVAIDSPGGVFFRQDRVGRGGRVFRIWKFRTMHADAPRTGPGVTVAHDVRITRVGSWLRRCKIDELPQLMNVLAGSMSLVGPRPELPEFVALYDELQRAVLAYRPGITDPASLAYRNEERILAAAPDWRRHYECVVMPDKLRMNLDYMSRATVVSDLGLILRTALMVVTPVSSTEGRR